MVFEKLGSRAWFACSVRAASTCMLAVLLASAAFPLQALAYYNRGEVSIVLGSSSLELKAGDQSSVTVSVTPSSDRQTKGCGMPSCPQGCAPGCMDENGQCLCGGDEYLTYYPTTVAVSSNASVAVAVCSGGALSVYAKSEGEATITVRASLRQFSDAETTLKVKVEGVSDAAVSSSLSEVDVPQEAVADDGEGRDSFVDEIALGRRINLVRIDADCNTLERLNALAGEDGDVIFWQGDSYFHPNYSLSFTGTTYNADSTFDFDPSIEVAVQATPELNQPLDGVDSYLIADFACKEEFPGPAEVYVYAQGELKDGQVVGLFSYDDQTKSFAREASNVIVSGGYAVFKVWEGKTYVISSCDLTTEAKTIIESSSASTTLLEGCCDPDTLAGLDCSCDTPEAQDTTCGCPTPIDVIPPFAFVVAGIVAVALVIVGALYVFSRKKKSSKGSSAKKPRKSAASAKVKKPSSASLRESAAGKAGKGETRAEKERRKRERRASSLMASAARSSRDEAEGAAASDAEKSAGHDE